MCDAQLAGWRHSLPIYPLILRQNPVAIAQSACGLMHARRAGKKLIISVALLIFRRTRLIG